jgi:hypothetical protein
LRQRKAAGHLRPIMVSNRSLQETRMLKLSIARQALVAIALGATCAVVFAQASAPAPGRGPGAASAPGMGMGPGGGMMRGWQGSRDNTSGWGMMNRAERGEHRQKMRSMTSADECKAYQDKHHAEMVERAKQRGVAAPAAPMPRHDPCARLKK